MPMPADTAPPSPSADPAQPAQRVSAPLSPPPPPHPLADSPRRWLALAALTLSVLIIGLDGTVINVALPTLSGELGASSAQLQWIGGGYLLALSVVMLPVGLLGDRYGHKRLLVGGITLFGLASLAGTRAGSPDELIAVRTVLGAGAAMIMPLSMAILPRIFSRQGCPRRSPPGPRPPRSACRSARWSAAGCSTTSGGARCSSSTCRSP